MLKWFLVIIALLALLLRTPSKLPKIIWVLWFQGWDKAPWVSKQCAESWKKMNPGWDVRLIDEKSCPVPIYGDTPQARSDVVRLELLAKYGGVWADSTMLCMQPLDSWVWKDIEDAGVWMYHGNKECKGPASWFIVAKPENAMMTKWVKECRTYWKGRTQNDNYFWMDNLWFKLIEKDQEFKDIWSKVPNICCEDPGQSHYLAGRVGEPVTQEIKDTIERVQPRAMKLSNGYTLSNNSNTHFFLGLL